MTQPNFRDLTGQKFGKLTVISRCENDKYGRAQWLCKCTCGRTRKVMSWCLTRSVIVHCGTCKTPITNYQKIKKMTVDQMAEIFNRKFCEECAYKEMNFDNWKDCIDGRENPDYSSKRPPGFHKCSALFL